MNKQNIWRVFYSLLFIVVQLAFISIFHFKTPWLPPLAKILNPVFGVWRGPQEMIGQIKVDGIEANVYIDDLQIPHIKAQDLKSLYFAQGYVHAQNRLLQIELVVRSGQGRISELVGEKALTVDRWTVMTGMREAAENSLNEMMNDPDTKLAIEAYTAGVNYYIKNLTYKTLPPEYKLLDAWPQEFQPIHVASFMKSMSARLAGKSFDLEMSRIAKTWGANKILQVFSPTLREKQFIVSEKFWKEKKHSPYPIFKSVFVDASEDLAQ